MQSEQYQVNVSREMVQQKKGTKAIRFFIEINISNKTGLNKIERSE